MIDLYNNGKNKLMILVVKRIQAKNWHQRIHLIHLILTKFYMNKESLMSLRLFQTRKKIQLINLIKLSKVLKWIINWTKKQNQKLPKNLVYPIGVNKMGPYQNFTKLRQNGQISWEKIKSLNNYLKLKIDMNL